MKVKIIGAGSIGNHLAHASMCLNWKVDLCDIDNEALLRTKNEIYPSRYKKWNEKIRLFQSKDCPKVNYDLIFIGTPPDSHIKLALDAIKESPKAIIIEKPLCTPDLLGVNELKILSDSQKVPIFVGYDHVVGEASKKMVELIKNNSIGQVLTIDFEFREHWAGIFKAHHWLSGPADTYLGDIFRGGGSSGEHSHALNLWQYFANVVGAGKVIEVQALMDIVSNEKVNYDRICSLNLKTENGLIGRVIQDVITRPAKKWGRIQGENGSLDWECGYEKGNDRIIWTKKDETKEIFVIEKTRPDDFIQELKHIELLVNTKNYNSPICLDFGLNTMKVLAAAHQSNSEGKTVPVTYN